MILSLFLLAAVAPATSPTPKSVDRPNWVSNSDYPVAALRLGEQGTVAFRLDISTEGRVTGCTITASSGSSTLDATTCRLMHSRARFEPARDKRRRPVASTFNSRIKWALPDGPSPSASAGAADIMRLPTVGGMMIIKADLTADGRVEKCVVETAGAAPILFGQDICKLAEASSGSPAMKQQGAIYRTIRDVVSISVDQKQFSIDGRGWGKILQRRTGEIHGDATGTPIRCVALTAMAVGPGPGFCSALPAGFRLASGSSAPAVRTVVFDRAVFGLPR